jgi:multicomponent Na+:H+ antiporter subunit E
MRTLLLNVFLGLTWLGLTGEFTSGNFAVGLIFGYFLLFVFRNTLLRPSASYFGKVRQVLYFFLYFAWELIIANLRVAYEVLTPGFQMRPAIVAIPLDVKSDLEITILANLITLTPGTLSLDVSTDNKTLYVHTMFVDDVDEFRASIKQGFEKRVQALFA